jgi:hypothetical protein
VRGELELVVERLERPHRLARGVRERAGEQPVGEPRVARQERPVQVRAECRSDATALDS